MRLNFWISQCFKFSTLMDVSSCLTLHWLLLCKQHDKIRYALICNFIPALLSKRYTFYIPPFRIYILQSTSIYFSSNQWALIHKALRWRYCRTICILWLWSSTAVASRLCIFCGCAALDRLSGQNQEFQVHFEHMCGPRWKLDPDCASKLWLSDVWGIVYHFLLFCSFIVGSSKWCSFISLENALCSWGKQRSIPAASMTPTDGFTGNIAAWPKKVSLLVFGLKPRREQPGVTWGLLHFLGVNFWLFFPSKLVDGIVMISSIILRWSALCQTAAYYMIQRRSSSSSQGSGCKTTICSGCSSALEWFCFHVSVSLEAPRNWVWSGFWGCFWLWLWCDFACLQECSAWWSCWQELAAAPWTSPWCIMGRPSGWHLGIF